MLVREVLCNRCSTVTEHKENDIVYSDGSIDREEYDWCVVCSHCVRGSIKRVVNGSR